MIILKINQKNTKSYRSLKKFLIQKENLHHTLHSISECRSGAWFHHLYTKTWSFILFVCTKSKDLLSQKPFIPFITYQYLAIALLDFYSGRGDFKFFYSCIFFQILKDFVTLNFTLVLKP